jgi:polysaccharide pyruvyl transferase WcaK-like protein
MTNIYCIRPKGFNVGNEVIHVGVHHELNQAFGETVNVINLPATSRWEANNKAGFTPATVHEINQYGDGVVVGGGNLYENGELDVRPSALETLEVPMMLFSLSMGRIYNRRLELVRRTDSMTDDTLRALHKQAAVSMARDATTQRHLASVGCESVLGACPTMFTSEVPQHLVPPATDAADALISVRTPNLMSVPIDLQMRVPHDIRAIADRLRELGYERVKLLCHDHRDIPFAASFGDLEYVYTDDVYAFLSLLKSARLTVSYRLHSVLPCLSYGTPVIKISYDERGTNTLDTVGMGDWNIDMTQEPSVIEAVNDRIARIDELPALREAAEPRWQEMRRAQEHCMSTFAERVRQYQARNKAASRAPALTTTEAL